MSVQNATFYVSGMTCSACESRISKTLSALEGVISSEVSLKGGTVRVEFEDSTVSLVEIKTAIGKAGYAVQDKHGPGTAIALGIGLLLVAAYLLANASGLFASIPKIDASIGYAMLFVVGLLTSIHCVAMCGGIALSQSLPSLNGDEKPSALQSRNRLKSLLPGLKYNAGRIVSYTAIGALAGALGSAFSFSPVVKGIIAAAAGLLMVLFGLRMIGLLKAMPHFASFIPKPLRATGMKLSLAFRRGGPFAVGILNGLMPCGPLQTMQLYALGTGSAASGALSMLIFSLGTVPLMLLFSVTATLLPRKFMPTMVKASAVLVMFLGFVTFARAATLAGLPLPFGDRAVNAQTNVQPGNVGGLQKAVLSDGSQSVVTEFKDGQYVPFAVQAGVPLKWTIRVTADELNGCNNPLVIPSLGIKKELVPGDNLIEFTPSKVGRISYSCWMGMIRSTINVVDEINNPLTIPTPDNGTELSTGGSCCSGTTNPAFADGKIPVDTIGLPVIRDGIQEITIDVTAQGYSPAAIVLQKGMKAIIKFNPAGLTSCNNSVLFPEFNGKLDLSKGQLETPAIPVTGDFTFQCWMGMLHGYVKTVDDISKVDMEKVKKEIGAIRSTGGSGGGCCGAPQ